MLARTEQIAHIGSWEWQIAHDRATWSDELFRIFRMNPAKGVPPFIEHENLFVPEDFLRLRQVVETAISHAQPYSIELKAIRTDGVIRHCLAHGFPELGSDGKVTKLFGSFQDISEHKQIEHKLQSSQTELQAILDTIPDYVLKVDPNGIIQFINRTYPGVTIAHVIGTHILEWIQPEHKMMYEAALAKVLSTSKATSLETQGKGEGGQPTWYLSRFGPLIENDELMGIIIVGQDITEQKLAEQKLFMVQKLESIGVLAGGIAHDFNNLLTGFFSSIELAKLRLQDRHESARYLDSALKSIVQAKSLTNQLLTFARGGEPILEVLSIAKLVEEVAKFAMQGSQIKLQSEIAPHLWLVKADEGQLSQVISNLIINAQQAMPTGGTIKIAADNVEEANGRFVRITIQDEGIGIAPQYLNKLFDPYFSTKQKGSGLGLSVSYAIIAKHGGKISVESQLNKGSRFTICLPAGTHEDEKQSIEFPDPDNDAASSGAAKHILIMDDQDIIRESLTAILEQLGYRITATTNGQEAVTAYQTTYNEDQPFDLVITDLTVPGDINGQAVAEMILQIDPQARLIVSSGYATDPVMANYQSYGFQGVIVKPYHIADLQKVIDQVIVK
jgi:PAS domain S-box-containing protein